MTVLFNTEQNKAVLSKFSHMISTLASSNDFEMQRNRLINFVINSMINMPEHWDKQCAINVNWIGGQFINRIANRSTTLDKTQLDEICAMCFRFLFELYLSTKNELSIELEIARKDVLNNIELFENTARDQINYALRDMPISIFKAISNSDSINSIKDFNAISAKAEKLKLEWENELSAREARVNQLKESLETYENGFNFVGLFQGFDDLSQKKINESKNILFWLIILSVLIVLPIAAELVIIYKNINAISAIKDGILVSIFPTVSIVVIAIYYFRVLLFNYKSVKSQLLQIDLRKTLCRFIQNYSDYSRKIKEHDAEALMKFENIIFSNIISDDSTLPSTYDGIEQIGKLIKSIKN